jgi:hypothetical protein
MSFEVLENTDTVSQIVFPVSWGIREGYSRAHSYSKITGGTFSQHLCNPGEVMNRSSSTPACVSRVITTHNLDEIRNLSARTVSVSSTSLLKGPIILGGGQSIKMLPEAIRGPPGAYGQYNAIRDGFTTFDDNWTESTSSGLSDPECKRSSDLACGGSLDFPGLSPVVINGSIKGDLLYRNVPRNRKPDYLHSSAAPEPEDMAFVPFTWIQLDKRKCRLPTNVVDSDVYAIERDPAHGKSSNSQQRPYKPRSAVVHTVTVTASSLSECKALCEQNNLCGIVTYEAENTTFGCTMALVPAASCALQKGAANQGVLLFPRDELTRLSTDAPSKNRKLVFPGHGSGIVLTTGNPTDIWGLPGLLRHAYVSHTIQYTYDCPTILYV